MGTASDARNLNLSDGEPVKAASRGEPGRKLASGCWLIAVPSTASQYFQLRRALPAPLRGSSVGLTSPARDLSQEPSAARKGAVCRPAGALEEECSLINSQKLKGLALWEQLPGQACQDATGPTCRSLSTEDSEGDSRREQRNGGSGASPRPPACTRPRAPSQVMIQ